MKSELSPTRFYSSNIIFYTCLLASPLSAAIEQAKPSCTSKNGGDVCNSLEENNYQEEEKGFLLERDLSDKKNWGSEEVCRFLQTKYHLDPPSWDIFPLTQDEKLFLWCQEDGRAVVRIICKKLYNESYFSYLVCCNIKKAKDFCKKALLISRQELEKEDPRTKKMIEDMELLDKKISQYNDEDGFLTIMTQRLLSFFSCSKGKKKQ